VAWEEVTAFGAGKTHAFRIKTLAPVLWKKAGPDNQLRVVVMAPVGYRLRKGSELLYRQPAYLICTDPVLPLDQLIQYYLWRWDVEVNHRDEKQIIGVGRAQVRSEQSVDRQPALAVASYAILLLAAARAFGIDAVHGALPPPKWQTHRTKQRLSTQELIRSVEGGKRGVGLCDRPAGWNGTAVANHCHVMGLRFPEFQSQLIAGASHQRVAMSTTLQDARFDPPRTVGHFIGGNVGQHRGVHGPRVGTRPRG
jgi:hypothetical protein